MPDSMPGVLGDAAKRLENKPFPRVWYHPRQELNPISVFRLTS